MFCCQFITICFVVNLLQRIVISSTIDFFMGFCVYNLNDKVRSDEDIKLNYVHHML